MAISPPGEAMRVVPALHSLLSYSRSSCEAPAFRSKNQTNP